MITSKEMDKNQKFKTEGCKSRKKWFQNRRMRHKQKYVYTIS